MTIGNARVIAICVTIWFVYNNANDFEMHLRRVKSFFKGCDLLADNFLFHYSERSSCTSVTSVGISEKCVRGLIKDVVLKCLKSLLNILQWIKSIVGSYCHCTDSATINFKFWGGNYFERSVISCSEILLCLTRMV